MQYSDQFASWLALVLFCLAAPRTIVATESESKISAKFGHGGNLVSIVYGSEDMVEPGSKPSLSIARDARHSAKVPLIPAPGGATGGTYKQKKWGQISTYN
jgi:hypothetical protein